MSEMQRQMPSYQCHKKVWALKLRTLERDDVGNTIATFHDPGFAGRILPRDYVAKHKPQEGGYYVVYDDGYESFSPAKAFEEGYTKI